MGLFLMETLRITHLFPGIHNLSDVMRKRLMWLAFGLLVTLIMLWPSELGEKADPFVTPEGIKPEWYFLSTYQLLKYFPKLLGILVSMVPQVLLLLWPFLDRSPERQTGARRSASSPTRRTGRRY